MSADAKTLYASNRAFAPYPFKSTVAVYDVSEDGLHLKVKQQLQTHSYPRGMALSRDGSVLVVESQTFGTVDTYKVLPDGTLTYANSVKGPPGAASLMVLSSPD